MKMKIVKTGINGEGIGYMDKLPVFVADVLADEDHKERTALCAWESRSYFE